MITVTFQIAFETGPFALQKPPVEVVKEIVAHYSNTCLAPMGVLALDYTISGSPKNRTYELTFKNLDFYQPEPQQISRFSISGILVDLNGCLMDLNLIHSIQLNNEMHAAFNNDTQKPIYAVYKDPNPKTLSSKLPVSSQTSDRLVRSGFNLDNIPEYMIDQFVLQCVMDIPCYLEDTGDYKKNSEFVSLFLCHKQDIRNPITHTTAFRLHVNGFLYDEIQTFTECVQYLADHAIDDKNPYSGFHLEGRHRPFCREELEAHYTKKDLKQKLTSTKVLKQCDKEANKNLSSWRFLNAAYQWESILGVLALPHSPILRSDEILSIQIRLADCYAELAHMMDDRHFRYYAEKFKEMAEYFLLSYHEVPFPNIKLFCKQLANTATKLNEHRLAHSLLYLRLKHLIINRSAVVAGPLSVSQTVTISLVSQEDITSTEQLLGEAAVAFVKDNAKAITAYSKLQQMWRRKLEKRKNPESRRSLNEASLKR